MPTLGSVTQPSTEKSESPRESMVVRDKDIFVRESMIGGTASGETRQCSPSRSDLDSKVQMSQHHHEQAISGSITDGHNPPPTQRSNSGRKSAECWPDMAQIATEIEIDERPSQMTDLVLDNLWAMITECSRARTREIERRLEAGVIKRIRHIHCCFCHASNAFPGGKCAAMFCQHPRCETCIEAGA